MPVLVLALAMMLAAYLVVPCHWIPVALDPEFTGWVAPVAARFADGMRLYTDGAHSPLPPLSFVVTYVVARGHPIWWHESALNFGSQAVAVFAVYGAARRRLTPWIALLVALGTLGMFLGIGKSLLYDSLTQAGVAVLGYAMLRWSEDRTDRWLVTAAGAGVVALLTKHNTGGAALLGAGCVILLIGRDVRATARFVAATVTSLIVALGVLWPLADPYGLWIDVVRFGSEPKGGAAMLVRHLGLYRDELFAWPREPLALRLALVGLVGCVGVAVIRRHGPSPLRILGVLTLVWAPAALAHSLSTAYLRWTYDNNPLIGAALMLLVALLVSLHRHFGAVAATILVALLAWTPLTHWQQHLAACSVPWPEVPALAGARMPPRGAPLRALAAEIRTLTATTDTVLLLPEDPDLFSVFGRPRPRVSSAILYMDQYWDRFVDEDVRRLRTDPPAVVVLGTNAMRFAQTFYGGMDRRTHRLAGILERDLLPARYRYVGERHYTRYDGRVDHLRVYLRRNHDVTAASASSVTGPGS